MSATEPIELEPVGGARALLGDIESALAGDIDAAHLHRVLAPSKGVFLSLLKFKPNNPASRAIIESGTVYTTQGLVTLDRVPDVSEICLLAEEAALDELTALSLVLAAQQAGGVVSAAAAAGVLYDERMCAVQALLTLLHAQVAFSPSDLPPGVYQTVAAFNAGLLQAETGGSTVLIARLADLIQSGSAAAPGAAPAAAAANGAPAAESGRLPVVIDAYGRALDRADVAQREVTALCQALLYATCIKQRLGPGDVERLLDLVHHLALHARAPGPRQLAAQHQASLTLLAALLTMLPLEDAAGPAATEDESSLRLLAQHAGMAAKVAARPPGDDPYAAVVRLAWGLLTLCCDDEALTVRGLEDVSAGLRGGAVGFLGAGVMGGAAMGDDDDDVRLTAASVVHQLLALFCEVAPEGIKELEAVTLAGAAKEVEGDAAGGGDTAQKASDAAAAMQIVHAAGLAAANYAYQPSPDTLAVLLQALAAVFTARPALFLDADRRSANVNDLLSRVGDDAALRPVPSVFLGYVSVLTALASSEVGARMVFAQLRGDNAPPLVGWRRMFQTLSAVVAMYTKSGKVSSTGGAGGGGAGASGSPPGDPVLPAADTRAMCAFAALYECVMAEGAPDEVASWVRQLDEEAGVAPAWEILFQVMCCPVPQALKAALDRAIAATARRPDLAAALWARLLAAVVVQPLGAPLDASVPRFDLAYQLNEIEARSEDYSEALAFVELLNALWRAGGSAMADEGRSVAHLTRFVREELLGTAFQRSFADEGQRWELVAAALEHCRLCLEALASPASVLAAEAAGGPGGARPPGLDVLLDLLGERSATRAALAALSLGVDRLAAERHAAPFGAAQEAAALAALRLLTAAFARDADFVTAARRSPAHGAYEPFESVLRHDRGRIPALMEYVRYPHSAAVQEAALRLSTAVAARVPGLVPLLLTVPMNGTGDVPVAQRLQDSFAACMHDAVAAASAPTGGAARGDDDPAAAPAGEGGPIDDRAALLLDLLLSSLEAPTPNLSQLLCGFWVDGGALPLDFADAGALHTPLRVVLDLLAHPRAATARPRLFEQCLELVYELAAAPDTGPATLALLRSYHSALSVPLLDAVACAPLPPPGPTRAASLHQRAWLLQLLALELRRADPALSGERDSASALLAALFGGVDSEGAAARGRFIDALAAAVGDLPAAPHLGAGASPDVRRMIAALDVEALLAGRADGGASIAAVGPRGDPLIDVSALKDELLARLNEWVARQGSAGEALKDAGRAALSYAAAFNDYAEEMGGRLSVLDGWQAAVSVSFADKFDLLAGLAGGGGTDLVLTAAEHTLQAAALVLSGPAAGLAPPLCAAIQALFARLQDCVLSATAADPLAGLPLPARCHALLQALLSVAWEGRGQESVRLLLYGALVSYLGLARGPALLAAPPAVVGALLEGARAGTAAASSAALDTALLRLEEGNVGLLHGAGRLLHVMAQDAASPSPAASTAALTALAAAVAADPATALADELHRVALPARLLQDLRDALPEELVAPPPAGQAATLVAEAKLALLLRLALAGPPAARAASAQKVFSLQALTHLGGCRLLDIAPEEPGFGPGGASTLRARLHAVSTPALRLALALLTALPSSVAVREQAAGFVAAHARALARTLRDAASPGVRGWEPADSELDAATLVARLLAELAPHQGLLPAQASGALQEAAYRAASRFLAANSRSHSPPVARVAATREAGAASPTDQRTYGKIVELRAALAAYLRTLSASGAAAFPCVATPGAGGDLAAVAPTLFLIKDALLQAAVHDLPDALGEQEALMAALRRNDAAGAATADMDPAEARAALVRAATLNSKEVGRLKYLIEQLLAILYQHLRGAADGGRAALAPSNGGRAGAAARLGTSKDLDQLRRLTEPAIAALERAVGERALPGDAATMDLLVRRTKDALAAAASSALASSM